MDRVPDVGEDVRMISCLLSSVEKGVNVGAPFHTTTGKRTKMKTFRKRLVGRQYDRIATLRSGAYAVPSDLMMNGFVFGSGDSSSKRNSGGVVLEDFVYRQLSLMVWELGDLCRGVRSLFDSRRK